MTCIKLGLLGAFEMRGEADRLVAVLAKKSRGLLAVLALSPSVPREKLANLLWSDRGDAQARSSLRQALASLRRDLGPVHESAIRADDERISIDQTQMEIDTVAFQRLAGTENVESLSQALALYRGELLEDTTISDPAFEEWIAAQRARLHDLAVAAIERSWAMESGYGRIGLAKRLVAIEPLREFAHLALMQSYAEAGEDGLALQHYAACRNLLKAELGITPGQEIEALRLRLAGGRNGGSTESGAALKVVAETSLPGLPDKPSIAVLPFQNLSGDPEQDYFADGVVEEIIIALSRLQWLFVIARNSSFAYRGRAVDMKQIGRELGVRYVLAPRLEQAEIERIQRKPTESLDAYDHFLRGIANLHTWTSEGNQQALSHFYRAIELDPNYAAAHGLAARTYVQRNSGGWMDDFTKESAEAERLARRAVHLGQDDAVALSTAGFALSDICGAVDDGDAYIEKALALNPNLASAWLFSGWVKASKGEADVALERLAYAKRLSPNDPQDFSRQGAMSFAHFVAGNYLEGLACAEAALRIKSNFLFQHLAIAVCAALAGRNEQARKAMARIRQIDPTLRISLLSTYQTMRPEDFARWKEGLRKAGLLE